MNYFFSGIETFTGELKARIACACTHRLQSCHGSYIRSAYQWADAAVKNPGHQELMLDSGAFTAWSKGHEVKLEDLVRIYRDIIDRYDGGFRKIWLINLDKIPGSPGRTADQNEMAEAIQISDENYAQLVDEFGSRVIPVFHQGESEERLEQICDMASYVCVSPRNDLPERHRVAWSQYVHGLLPRSIRTHGLATTGSAMLTTVPWYSADSASWVFAGALGNITVLRGQSVVSIAISEESPERKKYGKHYDTLSADEQRYVDDRLQRHGFTVSQVRTEHGARMAFNMLETMAWMDELKTTVVPQPGLFPL